MKIKDLKNFPAKKYIKPYAFSFSGDIERHRAEGFNQALKTIGDIELDKKEIRDKL